MMTDKRKEEAGDVSTAEFDQVVRDEIQRWETLIEELRHQ